MKNNKNNAYEAPSLFTKIYQLLMKFPVLQNIRASFYFLDSFLLLFIKKPRKKQNEDKKKLLVVFSFALGDCIMFLKAMEGIRELYDRNQWEITVTCQRACKILFTDLADRIIGLEYTKASVSPKVRFENYKQLRDTYYDLVIDPISSSDCSPNVFASRAVVADEKIGILEWEPRKYQCPSWMRKKIYTRIININEKNLHRVRLYEKVVQSLGKPDFVGGPAKLPVDVYEKELPDKFFIIFPSASLKVKKWPIDRCAEIADRVVSQTGYPMVLCGTEHDRSDAEEMLSLMKVKPEIYDCIGETNVLQLADLIGKAQFVITNDTSVYHIAVAKQRKTFLLCGGYVYKRFALYDYDEGVKPVLINRYRECYDCNNNCTQAFDETYPCVDDVTVEDVWSAVKSYIEDELI